MLQRMRLQLLAGDGILEVDINPNPLRTELVGDMLTATPGVASLGPMPGLGFEPDLAPLKDYRNAVNRQPQQGANCSIVIGEIFRC